MQCMRGREVVPLRSAAGWYLGTLDEENFPNCRLTSTYAVHKEEAEQLPIDREDAMENIYCNKCGKCKIK